MALEITELHHVSLPVADVERSKQFYGGVLGLEEIQRPPFDFPGAWYRAGDRQLHLIQDDGDATLRGDKGVDSRDAHFALRVRSFRETLAHLESQGFREDLDDADPRKLKASPHATAGFPQIYVLDPDRNVVEINAAELD